MKIKVDRVNKTEKPVMDKADRRLGEVSVIFEDEALSFIIKVDVREVEKDGEIVKYISLPSRTVTKEKADGTTTRRHINVVTPRNTESREFLTDFVLGAFDDSPIDFDGDFEFVLEDVRKMKDVTVTEERSALLGIAVYHIKSGNIDIACDARLLGKIVDGELKPTLRFPSRPKYGDEEGFYPTAFPANGATHAVALEEAIEKFNEQ